MDDPEYVSMHHRIRRSLRKRLKVVSAECERPVTDIVNEAIETWLQDRVGETSAGADEIRGATPAEKLEWLRTQKNGGNLYRSLATLSNTDLIGVAKLLGEATADRRMSQDRLVTFVLRRL